MQFWAKFLFCTLLGVCLCFSKVLCQNSGKSFYYEGLALAKSQKHEEALAQLKMADQYAKNNPSVLFAQAYCYYRIKKHGEARKLFRKSIKLGNPSFEAHFYLGIQKYLTGMIESAKSDFAKASKINPESGEALIFWGEMKRRASSGVQGVKEIKSGIEKLTKRTWEGYLVLSEIVMLQDELEPFFESEELLSRCFSQATLNPDWPAYDQLPIKSEAVNVQKSPKKSTEVLTSREQTKISPTKKVIFPIFNKSRKKVKSTKEPNELGETTLPLLAYNIPEENSTTLNVPVLSNPYPSSSYTPPLQEVSRQELDPPQIEYTPADTDPELSVPAPVDKFYYQQKNRIMVEIDSLLTYYHELQIETKKEQRVLDSLSQMSRNEQADLNKWIDLKRNINAQIELLERKEMKVNSDMAILESLQMKLEKDKNDIARRKNELTTKETNLNKQVSLFQLQRDSLELQKKMLDKEREFLVQQMEALKKEKEELDKERELLNKMKSVLSQDKMVNSNPSQVAQNKPVEKPEKTSPNIPFPATKAPESPKVNPLAVFPENSENTPLQTRPVPEAAPQKNQIPSTPKNFSSPTSPENNRVFTPPVPRESESPAKARVAQNPVPKPSTLKNNPNISNPAARNTDTKSAVPTFPQSPGNTPQPAQKEPKPATSENIVEIPLSERKVIDKESFAKANEYLLKGIEVANEGRLDDGIDLFTAALEINPYLLEAAFNRAIVYEAKGNDVQALEDYNNSIRINSRQSEVHFRKGGVLVRMNKIHPAILSYNKAIELKSNYPEAYLSRAKLLISTNEYSLALRDLNKLLNVQPKSVDGLMERAFTAIQLKDNQAAMQDYNKIIGMDASNGIAYYNRGTLWLSLKNKENACADFNRAAQLGLREARSAVARFCNQ